MACLVTLRARDGLRQWNLDDWTSLVAIAALAAEPETLSEWFTAMRRYQPEHELHLTGSEIQSLDEASSDEAWCLVDLAAKIVLSGGGYDLPDPRGAYETNEEEDPKGFPIVWLDTPGHWQFSRASVDWQDEIARRITLAKQRPLIDARGVLFGRPLFEFLAEQIILATSASPCRGRKDQQDLSRAIHAQWLMTARADLGGKSPRAVLLADRNRIQSDLEHRSEQWSRQGRAPVGLATTSAAYLRGGFGTTEVVLYFDLVRSLLDKAWKLMDGRKCTERSQLIERLATHCESWLHQPYEAGESAAELIDRERQRLPMISNGAHFDCDCPICRAEADGLFGSAPMFMWFDGHHLELEDEFAFSLCETEEQWLEEQKMQHLAEDDLETSGRNRKDSDHDTPLLEDSVWETSYVDWNHVTSGERSTQESLFALAFPVAELVSHVKMRSRGRPHVDSLNDAYDQLRRAGDIISARSAAGNLCQTLEGLAHAYPDLVPRCADLQSHIDEVVRRFR
jgi:hypothetical protein